jgi:hypothetical protein
LHKYQLLSCEEWICDRLRELEFDILVNVTTIDIKSAAQQAAKQFRSANYPYLSYGLAEEENAVALAGILPPF